MMKIYLPINNDNINIYFNTREANQDITKLNREALEKILLLSFGKKYFDYQIIWENRSDGLYFIVETETEKKWIAMSADYTRIKKDGGSTNAYFVQFLPMAIVNYFFDKTKKQKKIELYLKGTEHQRARTKAQQVYYRLAKTAGIKILNEFEFPQRIRNNISTPFTSISEWKFARNLSSSRNRSNKPSYVIENEDSYTFYGKTFGANGRESIFLLYVLSQLAMKENKYIYLFEVNDNGTNAIESSYDDSLKKFKNMLIQMNVVYYEDSKEYEGENLDESNKNARYQAEFMKNLLNKFNCLRDEAGNILLDKKKNPILKDDIKRCYLCGCDIQKVIIASHIHRITDINHTKTTFKRKRKMAVDGDNGLWLCASHDKLFEYGLIYFQDNKLIISEHLNETQKKYVELLTYDLKYRIDVINEEAQEKSFYIHDWHYTNTMHQYLEIHRKRIQTIKTKNTKKKKKRKATC